MVELLSHEVRFGELSWGPFVHYTTFFDLLIRSTEELSDELHYAAEAIVDADGERTSFPAEAIEVVSGA